MTRARVTYLFLALLACIGGVWLALAMELPAWEWATSEAVEGQQMLWLPDLVGR